MRASSVPDKRALPRPRGRRSATRILLLAALAALAACFFAFDLDRFLSIAAFKAQHAELLAVVDAQPIAATAAYMAVTIAALALCLPGSVLTLSLAGGAIFGFAAGLPIVLTAVVIGDSLAFLTARHIARGWVERRMGMQAVRVQSGVERDGALYLLSLRLMAVIPFFLVNLAMGLTRMPLRVFAPVSFVGLLPATAVYVFTGTGLAAIDSAGDIYSPQMIAAFVLLAAIPLAAALARRRTRQNARQG